MATVIKELKLDVGQKPTFKHIYAKQGDAQRRFLKVTLVSGNEKIVLETGATAKIRALLSDGSTVVEDATVNGDGTVTAELTDGILAKKGVVKADIAVYSPSGQVLSTEVFCIKVQQAPIV